MEKQTLELDGFDYCYSVVGTRHSTTLPLFFINGAFQDRHSWKKLANYFSQFTQVITADLPGSGEAGVLPANISFEFLERCVIQVLDKANIAQCCIASTSYGSLIAYALAVRYPQRVYKLVLSGVMKSIPEHLRLKTINALQMVECGDLHNFANTVLDELLCNSPTVLIHRKKMTHKVIRSQLMNMSVLQQQQYIENTKRILFDESFAFLQAPKCESLIFTGEHDVYTSPQYCREFASHFANAWFTTLPNTDHLFYLENYRAAQDLLEAFYLNRLANCKELVIERLVKTTERKETSDEGLSPANNSVMTC